LYLVQVSKHPELHKIGITSNPNFRFESFEEDNPGKNITLKVIYIKNNLKHETFLKDYFSNRAVYYTPLAGNGATEVFRLTWLDLAICVLYMEKVRLMQNWKVQGLLFIGIPITFIAGLYYLDPELTKILLKAIVKFWLWVWTVIQESS
jgi:hypothetical protein